MAQAGNTDVIDDFEEFYRTYYRDEIGDLARKYPSDQRSLYVSWNDLYRFDSTLAEDVQQQPDQFREYAEEALRLYDLPVDVSLGQAHVRVRDLPDAVEIRDIRARHRGQLVAVQGIVRKATDVRPKVQEAAFECQRCGTLTRIPQTGGDFQEPHECQGCERQGPFRINYDQSEFVDAQKLRVQESPEGLRGGETPQNIDVHIEDDITGEVTAGDHVRVTGVLHLDQQESNQRKSAVFDVFMDGWAVEIEDEQFEEMDISEEDKREIIALSDEEDIYEQMIDSMAPSIYGYDEEKMAIILQLFSGVTKRLPDESRIRGDLHVLLIGDPGTGKCQKSDSKVVLADGRERELGALVEENLDDPEPVDDGVWDTADFEVPSLAPDGTLEPARASRVWKREAPGRMYRIRTASGRELEVTPSHPLFRPEGGSVEPARADELSEGDFLAAPRSIPTAGRDDLDVGYRRSQANNAVRLSLPDEWTPSLARLVGYVVAEGYATLNDDGTGSVTVTNEDRAVLDDVADALERLDLPYTERESRDGTSARSVACTASEFVSFLENLEPAVLESSADQRVPDAIARASPSIKRSFLKAYVEGEAHVSTSQREITVASTSRDLLEDVRSLLLSFGIQSTLHPRENGSHRLRIGGRDFERYVEEVGFVTERKAAAAAAFDGTDGNTNTDVIPNVDEELRRIREALALSQSECGVARTTYQHYERGDRNPGRESLRAVIEAFEDRLDELRAIRERLADGEWKDVENARAELDVSQAALAEGTDVTQGAISYYEREAVAPDGGTVGDASAVLAGRIDEALSVEADVEALRRLVENDLRWDRIESIGAVEPDEDWVYDLEVEGTHSYLANGVVSHNSQLLQYVRNIAPRSVYTSGKGSSSAGLCVTGDTLVQTDDGLRQIRDVVEEDLPTPVDEETSVEKALDVQTFDRDTGEIAPQTTSHAWRMPEKPCRRIETAHGKELEASENTPVLTCGEGGMAWKPLSEVDPGDHVAVPDFDEVERSTVPVREFLELTEEKVKLAPESVGFVRDGLYERFGTLREAAAELDLAEPFVYDSLSNRHVPLEKLDTILDAIDATREDVTFERAMLGHGNSVRVPERFDEGLMYLLGLVFGDGDIALDRRGGNGMVRISNGDEALLERAADVFESAFEKRPEIERQDDRVPSIRVNSATIARLFHNAGMRTPKDELALAPELTTAEHADAFLRGLMDADGSVSARTNGGSSVLLSTISRELARQVQLILESYGVRARVRERDRRGTTELDSGQTIESNHVQHSLEIYGNDLERYADAIGFESAEKREALEGITGSDRRGETMPVGAALTTVETVAGEYHTNVVRGRNPGRERARSIVESVDLGAVEPLVEEVVDADLGWDEVVAAVDVGRKEVFDLTVPETHNFVANGVVTHNTAAAVQDDFGEGQQWTLEAGALVLADQGIAAVDELDKMRCVTGGALVQLGDGRIERIGELAREAAIDGTIEAHGNGRTIRDVDLTAWTMADDGTLVRRDVTAVHEYDAPGTLTDVELETGEALTTTPDHPFYLLEDGERVERAAEDLEPGDWVYVPQSVPRPASDGGVVGAVGAGSSAGVESGDDEETALAAVLGYLSGDGNVTHDREEGVHCLRFTNAEEQLLDDFERVADTAFDAEPYRAPGEQRDDGAGTVRLGGREHVETVLAAGMNLETYDAKAFPTDVSEYSTEAKAAFVRALADSEGTVDAATGNVRIFSSSRELLTGTRQLLLQFGVRSQLQVDERDGRRDCYALAITDADALASFRRSIGFTLDRKRAALDRACETVSGDRTILDVVPDVGELLADLRESLRLHQSECGLDAGTYCDFENGNANVSRQRAREIVGAFVERRREAEADARSLAEDPSWDALERLTDRYHVSQTELAEGTRYSQQEISRTWGESETLREVLGERLLEILREASETDLDGLRELVEGDVEWRRVASTRTVEPDGADDRIPVLEAELADELGCATERAEAAARSLLEREVDPETVATWDGLRTELDRHGVSFADLAGDLGVAPSTVSRWFGGVVETDRFEDARSAAFERIRERRERVRDLLEEIESRREPKVYDLTVEGTHNFLANGTVVHNSEDRSAMHEALEQQSYHPNQEILLADGRRERIGDLVDGRMAERPDEVIEGVECEIMPVDDLSVHSADLDSGDVEKLPVDRVSRHEAPEEFVRVTFSNGREVTVTPDHPTFVDDGSVDTVPASEIEEGAFVPAPRKLPNSAEPVDLDGEPTVGKEKDVDLPDAVTPDLGEVLGLLVAEGHTYAGSSHEVGFSNQDERLLGRMDRLMTDVFGVESTDTTNAAGTVTKRWVSTKLYRWFESNVPEVMGTAREKRIPAAVLGASEEVIRRFLVGAFAGDGGVESEAMSFSTASPGLAEDYADALAKVGVASRIHHDATEDPWKTYVMGDSTERFVESVVEPADDRYEAARAFADRSEAVPRHHDVLPTSAARELRDLKRLLGVRLTGRFKHHLDEGYGVQVETVETEVDNLRDRVKTIRSALADAETVAEVREAVGWSGRQLAERLDGETASAVHYAEDGGYGDDRRERLTERAVAAVETALAEADDRLDALAERYESDLRYYRVTDVETVPNEGEHACEWVYDVTVEPTNTFVSSGVVLHNSISISKAGINATLKSRCSLLGAANPKYGRFDEYEAIAEQIDLEPALISRFDIIFTVTDKPDPDEDRALADHIIRTNYAGELNTHRNENATSNVTQEEVDTVTEDVEPTIDADLLRKYIAYAKRSCFPIMTEDAKERIEEFYVDLRSQGTDGEAPVPVTARKLEALVRLAEASARVRLSDTVEEEDAERVIEIVRSSLEDIGMDPETGEFDVDMVETGTSKSQRDRIKNLKGIISELAEEYDDGAPVEEVLDRAEEAGIERSRAEEGVEKLRRQGDVYEPRADHLRTV